MNQFTNNFWEKTDNSLSVHQNELTSSYNGITEII